MSNIWDFKEDEKINKLNTISYILEAILDNLGALENETKIENIESAIDVTILGLVKAKELLSDINISDEMGIHSEWIKRRW